MPTRSGLWESTSRSLFSHRWEKLLGNLPANWKSVGTLALAGLCESADCSAVDAEATDRILQKAAETGLSEEQKSLLGAYYSDLVQKAQNRVDRLSDPARMEAQMDERRKKLLTPGN